MSALAKDLLSPEQLALVRKRSDLRGTWLVIHAWGVIFGAMAVFVAFPNPLTYILAVMVIGARQLGLAILMHDGAHGILTQNQKLNMFLSQWFCAYPMLAETGAYRRYHLKHHANTQQPEDPDLVLSAPFPITRKSFKRKMIRDITGPDGIPAAQGADPERARQGGMAARTAPEELLGQARPCDARATRDLRCACRERSLVSLFRALARAVPHLASGDHAHPQYRGTCDGAGQ